MIRVLEDAGFALSAARFSPDGRLVATAGFLGSGEQGTGHVKIWDWERGEVVRTISTDASWVDFDPSGSRIATASALGQAEIWDVESGSRVAVLAARSGSINEVAFSPDGSRVATGSVDGTVRLFDADTGAQLLVLRGHECGVTGVAFSPDGTKLASSSECGDLRRSGPSASTTCSRSPGRTSRGRSPPRSAASTCMWTPARRPERDRLLTRSVRPRRHL